MTPPEARGIRACAIVECYVSCEFANLIANLPCMRIRAARALACFRKDSLIIVAELKRFTQRHCMRTASNSNGTR
jgi:hypothetical protein